MNTSTTETQSKKSSRPILLVILCISTFAFSTIIIIANLSKYASADKIVAMHKLGVETDTNRLLNMDSGSGKYASSLRNLQKQKEIVKIITPTSIRTKCIYLALASILLLLGAFLMFKLKQVGLYYYLAGTVVWIIGPIAVYGFSSLIFTNLLLGVLWVIFAILYGNNLKYMK
jgi:uncharacterized membrane protein